jgi:hypothetical protein
MYGFRKGLEQTSLISLYGLKFVEPHLEIKFTLTLLLTGLNCLWHTCIRRILNAVKPHLFTFSPGHSFPFNASFLLAIFLPLLFYIFLYCAFWKSLCTYKRCWKAIERNIVSKTLMKQLHTVLVLHFSRCLTTEYSETTAHFNGSFDTDNQIYVQ